MLLLVSCAFPTWCYSSKFPVYDRVRADADKSSQFPDQQSFVHTSRTYVLGEDLGFFRVGGVQFEQVNFDLERIDQKVVFL